MYEINKVKYDKNEPPPIEHWYKYTVVDKDTKEKLIYYGTESGIKNYNFTVLDKRLLRDR